MSRKSIVRRLVVPISAGLIGIGFAVSMVKGETELPVYTRGTARMMRGEAVYRVGEPKPFTYPPFSALPFVVFAAIPEGLHRTVWYFMNVGMLAIIVRRLSARVQPVLALKPTTGPPITTYWLTVLAIASWYVNAVFEKQSHDMMVFLFIMLAVDASCRARDATSGLMAGLAAAAKATPLLFGLMFTVQRRWLAIAVMGVALTAATLAPDLVFPARDGRPWVVSWYYSFVQGVHPGESAVTPREWTPWNTLNQNLAGSVYRLLTATNGLTRDVSIFNANRVFLKRMTVTLQVLVLVLVILFTFQRMGANVDAEELAFRRLGEGGVVIAAMLLLSPWSSKTHFVVLLVPIAFCTAHWFYRKRDPLVGAFLCLVFLIGLFTAKDLWGRPVVNAFLDRGSVAWAAALMLLASGRVLMDRSAPGGPQNVSVKRDQAQPRGGIAWMGTCGVSRPAASPSLRV